MSGADFAKFYSAVHGQDRKPFPWQCDLALKVLQKGAWPECISVPTACGKTSVLDIAVFALAAQGELGIARTAPMRIFFVVDRRLVVDDVTRHACKIREALEAGNDEMTRWVRAQLKKPLAVAALRGGMYRSDSWADEPDQPLICVSTVDQVGSRLLFRGYGVSPSRRPVDAGLVGNDSLIILDEAHLSNPFLETLHAVRRYQAGNGGKAGRPLQMVEMSATTRRGSNNMLTQEDRESELGNRLSREKRVQLKEAASLEAAAVEEAKRLQAAGSPVVAIVMNSVGSARTVFEALGAIDKTLLTGRIRPYDRDRLLDEFLDRMKSPKKDMERAPLVVVATQTIEAGADLDFDAMVTEVAPLDCLIQRFGRLNRVGRLERAEGVILRPKREKEGGIYGEAPEKTWQWLSKNAAKAGLDFSATALEELLKAAGTDACISPSLAAPILTPAHLDAWVQTNPAPAEDPDVAPFLHGPIKSGDVQIVWRADLPQEVKDWTEAITAVPPLPTEALPLPIGAARRWLRAQSAVAVTDAEKEAAMEEEIYSPKRNFLIWRGPEHSTRDIFRLRPGDTVVVRSAEGGCDRFGWKPDSKDSVEDIGDLCNNMRAEQGRGKYRLRFHPGVFYPEAGQKENRADLQRILDRLRSGEAEAEADLYELVPEMPPGRGKLKPYSGEFLVWISNWVAKPKSVKQPCSAAEARPEESDEDVASSFTVRVTLDDHTDAVVSRAAAYAAVCGSDEDRETIVYAARMHDLGKLDGRFQEALDPRPGRDQKPLAKSGGADSSEYGRRLRRAGYPKGGRHEFVSVLIAEQAKEPKGCDRDLAIHLIGAHHGMGRPLAPFWRDDKDPEIRARLEEGEVTVRGAHRLARLDSGWIDRFWKLNGTYGWWGLAFLEAILRRADCMISREEQENSK